MCVVCYSKHDAIDGTARELIVVIEVRHLDGGLGLGLLYNTDLQMHYNKRAGEMEMTTKAARDNRQQVRNARASGLL